MKIPHIPLFLVIIFLLITKNLSGQSVKLRAQLYLVSGDSCKGFILAKKNIFYEKIIIESSFTEEFILINDAYKELKFKWQSIKKMELIDLKGKKRVFVQKDFFPGLLEVIYQNKVVWYKYYYYSMMDYTQYENYHIIDEKGTEHKIRGFNSKKNKLTKLCQGKEKIIAFIENNEMNDDNILKVLKMYETELQ